MAEFRLKSRVMSKEMHDALQIVYLMDRTLVRNSQQVNRLIAKKRD
jgi:hypothetical protein